MLVMLLGVWVCARAFTWDSPLAYTAMAKAPNPSIPLVQGSIGSARPVVTSSMPAPQSVAYPQYQGHPGYGPFVPPAVPPGAYAHPGYAYYPYPPGYIPMAPPVYAEGRGHPAYYLAPPRNPDYRMAGREYRAPLAYAPNGSPFPRAPDLAPNDNRLMRERFPLDWHLRGGVDGGAGLMSTGPKGGGPTKRPGKRFLASQQARAPFSAQPITASQASNDRWMLDVFGFYRQGSSALSVTQGRQPIYGASQIAANLQWRARPSSRHDPRVYARAYHALVTGGESEIAAGVSARPIGRVPLRLYGEVRGTRNPAISDQGVSARTSVRPAAYAVSELAPQTLPLGLSLEAYGAAGYVGGSADTYFADGQAVLTRRLIQLGKPGTNGAVVSLGAGVWGGAQKDAQRVDVGPTLRFDVDIGNMPARVSVDYREQVAGSAEPESGVAATVSTRF